MELDSSHKSDKFFSTVDDLSWFVPGTSHHAFFIGLPESVSNIKRFLRDHSRHQRDEMHDLSVEFREQTRALSAIDAGVRNLSDVTGRGFGNVVEAIQALDDTFGEGLTEIKWMLATLDRSLERILIKVSFPRLAEAEELFEDSAKAIKAGFPDDAVSLLRKAVELKPTDYRIQLNLGMALILSGEDAEVSLELFSRAIKYAHASSDLATSCYALEMKAKLLFIQQKFDEAVETQEKAITIQKKLNPQSVLPAQYRLATYLSRTKRTLDARNVLLEICEEDDLYVARAALDKNFEPIRSDFIKSIDEILKSREELVNQVIISLHEQLSELRHLRPEVASWLIDFQKQLENLERAVEIGGYGTLKRTETHLENIKLRFEVTKALIPIFQSAHANLKVTEQHIKEDCVDRIEGKQKNLRDIFSYGWTAVSVFSMFMMAVVAVGWLWWMFSVLKTVAIDFNHGNIVEAVVMIILGGGAGIVALVVAIPIIAVFGGLAEKAYEKERSSRFKADEDRGRASWEKLMPLAEAKKAVSDVTERLDNSVRAFQSAVDAIVQPQKKWTRTGQMDESGIAIITTEEVSEAWHMMSSADEFLEEDDENDGDE